MSGWVDANLESHSSALSGSSQNGMTFGNNWTSGASSGVPKGVPSWVLYVAAGLVVLVVLRQLKKGRK